MTLPYELRLLIFQEVHKSCFKGLPNEWPRNALTTPPHTVPMGIKVNFGDIYTSYCHSTLNLMKVNRQLSLEAVQLFYGSCIFDFGLFHTQYLDSACAWFDMIGSHNARHVRHVRIMLFLEENGRNPNGGAMWRYDIDLGPRKTYEEVQVISWHTSTWEPPNETLDREPGLRIRTEKALDNKLFYYTKPGGQKDFDDKAWKDVLTTVYWAAWSPNRFRAASGLSQASE